MTRRARIVGGGVAGLTCAIVLADRGFDVEVWERDPPERCVSRVAAAIWFPYQTGPADAAERWAFESLAVFTRLADIRASGVELVPGRVVFPSASDAPEWLARLPEHRELEADERPAGYAIGCAARLPVIETSIFLPWLRERCRELGVRFERRALGSLDEAAERDVVVVNCTGLGARELCGDTELVPVRGQVVSVERRAGDEFLLDDHSPRGLTYVVPRSADCVLGGTSERERSDERIDADATRAIVERCTAREPRIAGRAVLGARVGLRPYRPAVRVEAERRADGALVVHDYGHGGAGVTLSFGCAREVAAIVERRRGRIHDTRRVEWLSGVERSRT